MTALMILGWFGLLIISFKGAELLLKKTSNYN